MASSRCKPNNSSLNTGKLTERDELIKLNLACTISGVQFSESECRADNRTGKRRRHSGIVRQNIECPTRDSTLKATLSSSNAKLLPVISREVTP